MIQKRNFSENLLNIDCRDIIRQKNFSNIGKGIARKE